MIRPFTITIPEPLLLIGDIPILEIVLKQLSDYGFERVIVTLGHMAHLFIASIGDSSRFGIRIKYQTFEMVYKSNEKSLY